MMEEAYSCHNDSHAWHNNCGCKCAHTSCNSPPKRLDQRQEETRSWIKEIFGIQTNCVSISMTRKLAPHSDNDPIFGGPDEDKDIVDMNIGREMDMGMAVDSLGRSMDQFSLPVSTAHADAFTRAYAHVRVHAHVPAMSKYMSLPVPVSMLMPRTM